MAGRQTGQSGVEARIAKLESRASARGPQAASFSARPGEVSIVEFPSAGGIVVLPPPASHSRNAEIQLLIRNSNPVRVVSLDGLVNGVAEETLNAAGLRVYLCDGVSGWFAAPSAPSSGFFTWAYVLSQGNTSGAFNPTISSGQHLAFAAGGVAGGDIRSVGPLVITAGDTMHLHTTGDLHVGHIATTQVVHIEGVQIDFEATTDILAQVGTSFTVNAGTLWEFAASGGDGQLQASGQIRFITNGISRLVIETDGSWNIGGSNGSANNVFASAGSAAAPAWTSLSTLLDNVFGSTQGSILYRNGSAWVVLGPGTATHVLTTGGAGANPSWAAPASSGLTQDQVLNLASFRA